MGEKGVGGWFCVMSACELIYDPIVNFDDSSETDIFCR